MSRLSRAIAIRPGEGRLVALVAGAFAAVEAGRGLGEVGVDTLVLSRSGADILPTLYIGLGVVGLVITLGYGVALSRSRSQRFFPGLLVLLAGVLGVEWLIALSGAEAILPFVWISVYAAGLLLLTAMWTVGGFTFDARQAKRLFPLLTSAAIVGSLTGFLSAIVVQRLVGAELLILAEAVLFLVAAGLLSGLGSRARPRRVSGEVSPSVKTALTAGASYVAASPLMRLVAIAYVLLAILMFSLTFPFMSAMSEAFPDESELLTVLALFSAAVTLVSFLAGTLLANRLYARFGVATVALALPVMYLLGFGLWMVRFTLATAVIVRFAQQVTQRGVSNAAWSSFYSVIPSRRRGQVLAFMDGVPGQIGTILSGVLLIIATSLAMEQVFLMGLVTAILCVVVVFLIRRAYASSIVATLREGRGEQVLEGGPGLEAMGRDALVIAELRSATSAAQPQERLLAADLLGRLQATEAAPDVRRLCGDEDAEVRRVAVAALSVLGAAQDAELIEIARNDEEPRVRAAAVTALGQLQGAAALADDVVAPLEGDTSPLVRCELAVALGQHRETARAQAIVDALIRSEQATHRAAGFDACSRIGDGLDATAALYHLDDPAPEVRASALRAAGRHGLGQLEDYTAHFDDPARDVRTAAAEVVRARPGVAPILLGILADGSDQTQETALMALDGHAEVVRDGLLAWAQDQVARAIGLRGHAAVLAGADEGSTAAFLGQVIRRREAAIESRLLQALAVLGAPEASGLIRRCLGAPDAEVRAQAIEALDALGHPRLARDVVRLLDQEAVDQDAAATDVIVTATALSDDRDRWVRALALRTLSEHLQAGQRSIAERVRQDPDQLIRDAVNIAEGEDTMPPDLQLVSEVDRMLVLRQVPIFEALGPEDLQRVAAAATEQSWGEGDELMVEGDVGSDMVVIVEGRVRVVHRDGGVERQLNTYADGDHIGELAVLRESTRAATVIAEAPGVRGLVISGEAVQALLRERPDAAMAMLATLAERIASKADMALPEGTVTFLRSDIEGSMDLVRALGARYDDLNAVHQGLVRAAVAEHAGQVVRTEGDAFFVVFTQAGAAARTAVSIQRAMADYAWPAGREFKVRIGIHTGAATRAGDDYGGFEVNRAARIAAAGWGGQIILSDATRALLSADDGTGVEVRDLGRHRLKGVPKPQPLFQLDAPGLSTSFPPLRSGYGPAEHLPEQRSSFVGREGELATLEALLAETRLLTLTGPGGTGKTTLALELARRHAAQFADGAWFVDLQAVRDADMVLPEMASSLSLLDGPAGPAADRLMGFVAEREMLIVVDNFEQVLEATPVVADLISASPRTKMIVTSRIPLRISAEQDYPVQPLGVRPDSDGSEGEAVRLFIERARRVRPDLSFDDLELEVVRETCALVDGLPLAVELSASRAAALPVPMIRDRLAARAPLPGSGPRDLPDRQRTIEETVAWSYGLLEAPLKVLVARLAVFRESFDYEQAEDVCGGEDDIGADVLDGLVGLTEHSMLTRVDDAVGGVRFRMLETIRAFAWDRLAESGRADEYQDRHARAYVSLAVEAAPHLEELDARRWRDRLEVDDANLRAALDWAVGATDLWLVHVGVGSLWRYWQITGRLAEGLDRTTTALAMPGADEPTPERIRVIAADGSIAYWQGDLPRAQRRYEEQLELAQRLDIASEMADAWLSLLFVSDYGGDMELGELAEASATRIYAELGDQQGIDRVALASVSSIAPAALSDPQRWMPELEARLARAEAIEGERAAMACIAVRSALRLVRGDASGAVEAATSVIRMASELGRDGEAVMMLPPIIQFAATTGQHEVATIALGAFNATRARFGALTETPFEAYGFDDPTETLRSAMGDEALDTAIEHGARMPLGDVTDLLEAELQTA